MADEQHHLLFVPRGRGYDLIDREGAAPEAGSEIEFEGRLLVLKVGPSPLPGDERRCAYVIPPV